MISAFTGSSATGANPFHRPSDVSRLLPQKQVGGATDGTAGGAECSADDRAHGTGTSSPFLPAGLHPRDRTGYRVSIPWRLGRCGCRVSMPRRMHRMAGVIVILVARGTVSRRHCRTRRPRRQSGRNDRQNPRHCSHRYLQACRERPRRSSGKRSKIKSRSARGDAASRQARVYGTAVIARPPPTVAAQHSPDDWP